MAEGGEDGLMATVPALDDGGQEGNGAADAVPVPPVCVSSESFLEKRGKNGEREMDTRLQICKADGYL